MTDSIYCRTEAVEKFRHPQPQLPEDIKLILIIFILYSSVAMSVRENTNRRERHTENGDSSVPIGRRGVLAGAAASALGLAAVGAGSTDDEGERSDGAGRDGRSPFAEKDHTHDGGQLGVDEPVASIIAGAINDVGYVDVAEGAAAVQETIDEADAEGHNKVVVYGEEGEWNETIYLPSEFTLEIRDGVSITTSITAEGTTSFDNGAGALITNADHENGNHDIVVRGGHIDFDGVDASLRWGPVWLYNCENSLFDSITVENVEWRYGVVFTDCTRSVMIDCVTHNIGYDGVTLRGTCEGVDVYRCEAYETGGPGIQAAPSLGGHGTGGRDINFTNCRSGENIAIHGVRGGAKAITVEGCTSRRISMIETVDDFRISDCDVDTVALSALHSTIRNGRVDSVTMGDRFEDEFSNAGFILWAWSGLVENIGVSNCTAHTDGHTERFAETRLTEEEGTARYIDFTNCAFDGDGYDEARFIQHTPDGEQPWLQSVGELSNVRIHDCKIWNVETVIEGEVDGVRIRNTEFHGVRENDLHDGGVTDLDTHENDWW